MAPAAPAASAPSPWPARSLPIVHALTVIRQCLQRVARAMVVLCGVSMLAFAAIDLPPGDFLSDAALAPRASREAIQTWRERFALDRPLPERYARWVQSIVRGEGGYSLAYQAPIAPIVWRRAPVTLLLGGLSLVVSWTLALTLGVWSAARAARWDGRAIATATTGLMGIPDLLLALGLLLVAARSGLLPTGGFIDELPADVSTGTRVASVLRHLLLPVAALSLSVTPTLLRHVRAALLDVLRAPYLVAQRARGVPRRRLLWRAALRAASHPLISLFGLSFATVFSGSMVVESIMSWPGLGPLFLDAIHARDPQVVLAGVMCAATLLVFGNLLSDMLLRVADPRIGAR